MSECQLCGGELALLGTLGRLLWLRCIACGMQFSLELDEDAYGDVTPHYDDEDEDTEDARV